MEATSVHGQEASSLSYAEFFSILANGDRERYAVAAARPPTSSPPPSPIKHAFDASASRPTPAATISSVKTTPIVIRDDKVYPSTGATPIPPHPASPSASKATEATSSPPTSTEATTSNDQRRDALIFDFGTYMSGFKDVVKKVLQDSKRRFRPLGEKASAKLAVHAAKKRCVERERSPGHNLHNNANANANVDRSLEADADAQVSMIVDEALYQPPSSRPGTWSRAELKALQKEMGKGKGKVAYGTKGISRVSVPVHAPAWEDSQVFCADQLESGSSDEEDFFTRDSLLGTKRKLAF